MPAKTFNEKIYRRRNATINFVCWQEDGVTRQNLTDCTLYFTAKRSVTDSDGEAVFQKSSQSGGIVVTDVANGKCTVTIDYTDTQGVSVSPNPVVLQADLEMVDALGEPWQLADGQLVLMPNKGTKP